MAIFDLFCGRNFCDLGTFDKFCGISLRELGASSRKFFLAKISSAKTFCRKNFFPLGI